MASPNEAELEIIFERMRQEYLMDLKHLRSDTAVINRINQALRFWPLKNLGEDSRAGLREMGIERREQMIIQAKRRRRKLKVVKARKQMWTDAQIKEIKELYSKKHIPVSRIAYKVGRTEKAVYMKAWRLKLKRR